RALQYRRVDGRVQEDVLAARLGRVQAAVEGADRVGRVADGEDEVGERLQVARGELARRAEEADERRVELLEGLVLGERVPPGVAPARAVAAPVHGAGRIGEPAEALRRHRPLHRMEARVPARGWDAEGVRVA